MHEVAHRTEQQSTPSERVRLSAPSSREAFPIPLSFLHALTTTFVQQRVGRGTLYRKYYQTGGEYAAREPKRFERALVPQLICAARIRDGEQTNFHVDVAELVEILKPQGFDAQRNSMRTVNFSDIKNAVTALQYCEFNFCTELDYDGVPVITPWRGTLFAETDINCDIAIRTWCPTKVKAVNFSLARPVINAWVHAMRVVSCDLDVLARITTSSALALYAKFQSNRKASVLEFEMDQLEQWLDPRKAQRDKRRGLELNPLRRRDNFILRFVQPAVKELNLIRPWGDRALRVTKQHSGKRIVCLRFELMSDKMIAARDARTSKLTDLFDQE